MEHKKIFTFIYFSLIIFIISITQTSAFSVASLYGDSYPLRMEPGETTETFILLRNVVEGDGNLIVEAKVHKGADIAQLIDGLEYIVGAGKQSEIYLRISVPADAELGKIHEVGVLFKPQPSVQEDITVQLSVNIGKSFPVLITGSTELLSDGQQLTIEDDTGLVETFAPETRKSNTAWVISIGTLVIMILAVIIILIIIILRKRKNIILSPSIIQQNTQTGMTNQQSRNY